MRLDEIEFRFKDVINELYDLLPGSSLTYNQSTAGRELYESIFRLYNKYLRTKSNENELTENVSKMIGNVSKTQLRFVDSVEEFFSFQYVCISKLAQFYNQLSKNQAPISNNTKFLNFICDTLNPNLRIINSINEIRNAKDYRSKLLIHPQQYPYHDWMTTSVENSGKKESAIVYINKQGAKRKIIESDLDFSSREEIFSFLVNSIEVKDFYISPEIKTNMKSVLNLYCFIIDRLILENNKPQNKSKIRI